MRALATGIALATTMALGPAPAQQAFRCTDEQGRVTYQERPCPPAVSERKVDTTPANPDYDPAQRERVLKQGDEAQRRLEERAAREEAERAKRQAERELEEKREREAREREAAREAVPVYYWPGNLSGSRPSVPPPRPRSLPNPVPKAPAPPTR